MMNEFQRLEGDLEYYWDVYGLKDICKWDDIKDWLVERIQYDYKFKISEDLFFRDDVKEYVNKNEL